MALKPWKPGQSGNPGGRRTKPMVDRMLEEALTANDSETAKTIADKLVSMAKHGSLAAIKLIAERTEGRPMRNASDSAPEGNASLTPEQVKARLAEVLRAPEVKASITQMLF